MTTHGFTADDDGDTGSVQVRLVVGYCPPAPDHYRRP